VVTLRVEVEVPALYQGLLEAPSMETGGFVSFDWLTALAGNVVEMGADAGQGSGTTGYFDDYLGYTPDCAAEVRNLCRRERPPLSWAASAIAREVECRTLGC
jgi:hypothetical protein